jgi:D-alanine--(R)-lactate ligase
MTKLQLAIIFGGASEEHPVSVKSAQEVARHLDLGAYEPVYLGITRDGAWRLCDGPGAGWEDVGRPALLSPDRGVRGLLVQEGDGWTARHVDAVLPVLHGRFGEDGAVQGLLELSGIPYVGCDVASSALCMDKSLAYLVVRDAGVATPHVVEVAADEHVDAGSLEYPVFVKPARSGSSFGVSRVDRPEDLTSAMAAAGRYDAKVLIEEAVVGSEVGCAVLETETGLTVGEIDQIGLSHGFFRIHQEDEPEVRSDNATVVVPAPVPAATRRLVQDTAKTVFRALGCRGLARVDLFLKPDGTVVLNEVNTFPGMTSYSRYPRMMAAAGLPLGAVIDRLVSYALHGAGAGAPADARAGARAGVRAGARG